MSVVPLYLLMQTAVHRWQMYRVHFRINDLYRREDREMFRIRIYPTQNEEP